MTYRRKNHGFNERLAVRHDVLQATTVKPDAQGRVIISALPYLVFPNMDCAEQFLRRVLMQRENRRSQ